MTSLLLIVPLAYLLGSIPFGLVLARGAGYGDIRNIGSGNIGATNVLRTGNKALAFFTLLLDGSKGAVAALLAAWLFPGTEQCAALAALLGHLFPIWLGFKGGKGVATTLGVLIALAWPVGLLACACWLVVAILLRMSSLSALVSIALTPLTAWLLGYPDLIWLAATIVVLVFFKHKSNIKRLIAGTEPKIGEKKTDDSKNTPEEKS